MKRQAKNSNLQTTVIHRVSTMRLSMKMYRERVYEKEVQLFIELSKQQPSGQTRTAFMSVSNVLIT